MLHSIKEIGTRFSRISKKRKDKKIFDKDDFIKFAKDNLKKYSISNVNDRLFISTWDSDKLICDYKKTIK